MIKYLAPIIFFAVALLNFAGDTNSVILENEAENSSAATSTTSYSSPCFDSLESGSNQCLPPRVLYESNSPTQVHIIKKRSNPNTNNIDFIKSGKIVNAIITNFIQKTSSVVLSSLTKPIQRLIRFGILII